MIKCRETEIYCNKNSIIICLNVKGHKKVRETSGNNFPVNNIESRMHSLSKLQLRQAFIYYKLEQSSM